VARVEREDVVQSGSKRVLVTGASGFIGRHLCQRLAALGAELHAITRGPGAGIEGVRLETAVQKSATVAAG
jgi:uncharacterized protein YbjT (DUF2867 family)